MLSRAAQDTRRRSTCEQLQFDTVLSMEPSAMSSPTPIPAPSSQKERNTAKMAGHDITIVTSDGCGAPVAKAAGSMEPLTPLLLSASQTSDSSNPVSDVASIDSVRTPPPHPQFLSDRRMDHKLVLSPDERATFCEVIASSKRDLQSDATRLPKSTNMGLGKNGPPAAVVGSRYPPPPKPMKPVADHERAMVLSDQEHLMRVQAAHSLTWEEAETFARPAPSQTVAYDEDNGDAKPQSQRSGQTKIGSPNHSPAASKAVFVRVIPTLFTENVANATGFYRDILGFSLLGKPDSSHAALVRSPTVAAKTGPGPRGASGSSYLKEAPADGLQVYLRIAPLNAQGQRECPPPTTLWIEVNDVDAVFRELQEKWIRFAPRADEYFPMHSFGDARILSKPQNKAWGNREMHIVDGDDNKIVFFKQLQ